MANIDKKHRSLSVEHDERRIYELGFGNPDKNFRNYKFFTTGIRFGLAPTILRKQPSNCSAMSVLPLPV